MIEGWDLPCQHLNTTVPPGVPTYRYHVRRLERHLQAAAAALRPRFRNAVLILAGTGGLALWYQALIVAAGRLGRHQMAFHHHSFAYVRRRALVMSLITTLGGSRLRHIALCDGMASELRLRYGPGLDVRVCSNAVFLAPGVDNVVRRRGARLTIGHLGNLSVEKGLDAVLRTAVQLRDQGVDVQLLLAGPTTDQSSRSLVHKYSKDLGQLMTYIGPVAADRVDLDFFSKIDLFLFPSTYRHEAAPMVALEAARSGVPTLAFDVGCLGSLVCRPDLLVPTTEDFVGWAAAHVAALAASNDLEGLRTETLRHFRSQSVLSTQELRRLLADLGLRPN